MTLTGAGRGLCAGGDITGFGEVVPGAHSRSLGADPTCLRWAIDLLEHGTQGSFDPLRH